MANLMKNIGKIEIRFSKLDINELNEVFSRDFPAITYKIIDIFLKTVK